MASVYTRVPAKVILMGEHFVVHGSRAISIAIDKFLYGRLDDDGEGIIRISGGGLDKEIHYSVATDPIAKYYRYLLEEFNVERPPTINLEFEFPISAGLGSSAAISAAIPTLLIKWMYLRDPSREELYNYGAFLERLIHGNPSGIDLTTVVEGGALLYKRGDGVLERVSSLPDGYSLLIIDSGERRVTGELVAKVSNNLGGLPEELRRGVVQLVDTIVARGWVSIVEGAGEKLADLLRSNHYLLKYVGVYTPRINMIINELSEVGVDAVKVTGAGGGGCIIAYGEVGTISKAFQRIKDMGLEAFQPNIYPYPLY